MDHTAEALQSLVDGQIGKGNVQNTVVAVQFYDRTTDFVGAAGVANPQTGAPMVADTPYFLASVTKMYTAAVVLKLHERGQLQMELPIVEYLPSELTHGIHIYAGTDFSGQIKVHQHVDQSSGLADYEAVAKRGKERPRGAQSGTRSGDQHAGGHGHRPQIEAPVPARDTGKSPLLRRELSFARRDHRVRDRQVNPRKLL